jgi:hypothetical protein
VKDEGDPDYKSGDEEKQEIKSSSSPQNIDQSLTEMQSIATGHQLQTQTSTISIKQVEDLVKLFQQKTSNNKERQTNFLTELDQKLTKRGIEGTTNAGNFRVRLATLTPIDYQYLYN